MQDHNEKFFALCKKFACTHPDKWCKIIEEKLTEPHRHYHNMSHIDSLFSYFEKFHHLIKEPHLVELAIFFHDIIYNGNPQVDEDKSAELFRMFAHETILTESETTKVLDMILATKSHLQCDSEDHDVLLFLDFDLGILGAEEKVYQEYTINVRKEYSHYNDEKFKSARAKFLKKMLGVGFIYYTQEFKDQYYHKAIENMKNELKTLPDE